MQIRHLGNGEHLHFPFCSETRNIPYSIWGNLQNMRDTLEYNFSFKEKLFFCVKGKKKTKQLNIWRVFNQNKLRLECCENRNFFCQKSFLQVMLSLSIFFQMLQKVKCKVPTCSIISKSWRKKGNKTFYTCFCRVGNGKDKIILVGKKPNPAVIVK